MRMDHGGTYHTALRTLLRPLFPSRALCLLFEMFCNIEQCILEEIGESGGRRSVVILFVDVSWGTHTLLFRAISDDCIKDKTTNQICFVVETVFGTRCQQGSYHLRFHYVSIMSKRMVRYRYLQKHTIEVSSAFLDLLVVIFMHYDAVLTRSPLTLFSICFLVTNATLSRMDSLILMSCRFFATVCSPNS